MEQRKMNDYSVGQDGGIDNFIDDITAHARESNGFVLEIGVATGTGSTIAIQRGLGWHRDPLHVSVDQNEDQVKHMRYVPVVGWWSYVCGDSRSLETLEKVKSVAGGRKAGLIFIDTDHVYEQMAAELPVWAEMADEDTVWLFHDTWMFGCWNEGMCKAIVEFAQANGWEFEDYRKETHGLGRMRKRKSK